MNDFAISTGGTANRPGFQGLPQRLVADGLIAPEAGQGLLHDARAREWTDLHALEVVADAKLHHASTRHILTLEELTLWLARRTGLEYLRIDPLKIDAPQVGDLVTGKVTKLASFGAFVGLPNDIDGLVHVSQVSEDRVDKIKNVLKVGDDVTARVIKIDRADRRIGLSIKAANYSTEQLKEEQKLLDQLKPGEDLVALEHAFAAAEEKKTQD